METSAISISLNQIPLTASCAASNNSSNRNVNLNFQNENSPLCPAKFSSLRSGDDCGAAAVGGGGGGGIILEARNDPDSGPNSTNTTPFIKRKCLQKELTSVHNSAIQQRSSNNSPYLISSVNLTNDANLLDTSSSHHSPRHNTHHLNDSYEMMESCSSSTSSTSNKSSRNCRYLSRRLSQNAKLFNKHKSAPLSNISFSTLMNQHHNNQLQNEKQQQSLQTIDKSSGTESHPLNDISNHINTTTNKYTSSSSSAGSTMTNKLGEDMSFTDEQRDDVADLENLIFGNVTNVTNATGTTGTNSNINNKNENNTTPLDHQSFIKQSLDIDATHRNLIGDRTKQHILPIIQSNKHQDLHCISPETLVDVLNGNYSDQISECVIIDSRYPYEYDGGHIATALNLFTKEKLFEEMFIRRLNFKNSSIHKFTSSYSTDSLVTLANTDCMETNSGVVVDEFSSSSCSSSAKFAPPKRSIVIFHCEFSSERGPSL
jgi:rhodanese-related sulfurtransferase